MPTACRKCAGGLLRSPSLRRASPRLLWASAKSGLMQIAARNWAIAASAWPAASNASPRLLAAWAEFGSMPRAMRQHSTARKGSPSAVSLGQVGVERGRPGLQRRAPDEFDRAGRIAQLKHRHAQEV